MNTFDSASARIEPIRWPAPVRRITLRSEGQDWVITQQIRVASMTLPTPDELPQGDKSRGFWIEARDQQGRVRHRAAMADPLAGMEQFDEDGQITRLVHPAHQVTIEVLIPDLDGMAELHLVSNPARAPHHGNDQPAKRSVLPLPPITGEPDPGTPPPPPPGHDHDHGR